MLAVLAKLTSFIPRIIIAEVIGPCLSSAICNNAIYVTQSTHGSLVGEIMCLTVCPFSGSVQFPALAKDFSLADHILPSRPE